MHCSAGPSERDDFTVLDNLEENEGKKVVHLVSNRSLKPQKKEFLKHRKLKRKGKVVAASGKGKGPDLEAQIMTDRHKPAFGEQALEPIKVRDCCSDHKAAKSVAKLGTSFLRYGSDYPLDRST